MDTQKSPKSGGKRRAKMTSRETLRKDRVFRLDAKRIGRTASAALLLDVAMVWLARSGLADDPNTHQLVVLISFIATMIVVSAALCFALRVFEEFFSYVVDRMNE